MRRSTSSPSDDAGRPAPGGRGGGNSHTERVPEGTLRPIGAACAPDTFPDPRHAPGDRPLAVGGDLRPERLVQAYRRGIFPWYSAGGPILWWSPDPRTVIVPAELRISRRLGRRLRRNEFRTTENAAFAEVIEGCAAPRRNGDTSTWITPEMQAAYLELHEAGHAHSIECWQGETLAGGLYGVEVGSIFCAESMFSRVTDASKVALAVLCAKGYALVDCQRPSEHLFRMGARLIARREFLALLAHFAGPRFPPPRPLGDSP